MNISTKGVILSGIASLVLGCATDPAQNKDLLKGGIAVLDRLTGSASTLASVVAPDLMKADLTPYRKLLSEDKLRIFDEVFERNLKCYGEGGKLLETPEEYAGAKIWASVGHPPNYAEPHWDIGIYHWDNMKLIKKTSDEGVGNSPPSAVFTWQGE